MATSSQGSAPGIRRKGPQTPGDLIIDSLEDLNERDFKRFKNKLSDFSPGDKRPVPRGRLENADWITTKDLLIDTYGEEGALEVTIEVFTLIGLMGPAKDLQDRRAQHGKLKKTSHDMSLSDFGEEYRESVEMMFQRVPEYNSRTGEAVSLQKRYTKLLMRKGHQTREEKEQGLRSTDRGHLQVMEGRSSEEYSPITIQDLFAPDDEDGFIPNIVVLQGPAGIGKTMTSKKIMLDWASGNLYRDKYDFVFYLSCRELNTITGNLNLVGLLSRSCGLPCSGDLVSILKDRRSHRRLLFLVDGFDELRWTLGEESEVCQDVCEQTHKEILLQSLLRKRIVQQSSLIITTRSLAMKKLSPLIGGHRYVEIQGFTREDREEYVHQFFGSAEDAGKALRIIRDNDVVYTMCAVPITCWIVCTVIQQEIKKDLGFIRCTTMTSVYLLYLEVLLTHHSKKDPPVDGRPRAVTACLRKLCALANEGVLKQQILFKEDDLQRHGLSLREVESVFLNENIFHWDVRTQTCYSFIHLSVQEFLAALHYVLDEGSGDEDRRKDSLPLTIREGESPREIFMERPHLALAVQFLFGLLNEKMAKAFSEATGINVSLPARSVIQGWAMEVMSEGVSTDDVVCLCETQDEDFIRRVMAQGSDLTVEGKWYDRGGIVRNVRKYSKEMDYCLKTLKSECFESVDFEELTLDPEGRKSLSLVVHRSRRVRFVWCTFQRRYGEDEGDKDCIPSVPYEVSFPTMRHDEDSSPSGDDEDSSPSGHDEGSSPSGDEDSSPSGDDEDSSPSGHDEGSSPSGHDESSSPSGHDEDSSPSGHDEGPFPSGYDEDSSPPGHDEGPYPSGHDEGPSLSGHDEGLSPSGHDEGSSPSGHEMVPDILSFLRNPASEIQALRLDRCRLPSSPGHVLRSILITNQSLIRLDLIYINLQDSGIKLLCEGLRHPGCTLQRLIVLFSGVTLSCCEDLCSVVTTNRTLTRLDVTSNDEKVSGSEVVRCCGLLRHAGFSVLRDKGEFWDISIDRRRR